MPRPCRHSVLVVDDDPFIRSAVSEVISLDGLRAIVANGGDEALRRVGRRRPWLVVTDYRMAEMSGSELVLALRQRYPGLPAVIMTAYASARSEIERLPALYVPKPFSLTTLQRAIAAATARRS